METFSALLPLCAGNSSVIREFPSQRPVTRSSDIIFDLSWYRLSKQSCGWWYETPSRWIWRHCNELSVCCVVIIHCYNELTEINAHMFLCGLAFLVSIQCHDDVIKWRLFSALLAFCAGNSPVTGEFPSQRASDAELWHFLWSAPWINGWVNNRDACDLRRHRCHMTSLWCEAWAW